MKPKQQIYSLPHLTTLEPSQFFNMCLIKNKNVFSMRNVLGARIELAFREWKSLVLTDRRTEHFK